MKKEQAIEKLSSLKKQAESLLSPQQGTTRINFSTWKRNTEVAIEYIFGKGTRHLKDFTNINYSLLVATNLTTKSEWQNAHQSGIKSAISVLESLIDEIDQYWDEEELDNTVVEGSAISQIELIIRKFHPIVRKLRSRHADRDTIEINDEYDVQDLFSALLCLFFEDIRPEEYTPSYAGSASRVDFLLKKEKIVIEIKKTRQNLKDKEIGEQLIIDAQKYRSHPDCERLICFVYDPEEKISNPRAIENDLTKEIDGLPVSVFITPQ